MTRSRLKNVDLKNQNTTNWNNYNDQRSFCTNLLQKTKFDYFRNLEGTVMDIKLSNVLDNNKYMIDSIQITNTEIFTFMSVLDMKLLSCKILFTNRKRQQKS